MGAGESAPFCCGNSTCCKREDDMHGDGPKRPTNCPAPNATGEAPIWYPGKGDTDSYADSNLQFVEGEETYEDNSNYRGQLLAGHRHGRGVWTSSTEQYSGQWVNDQRDGFGKQTWQDGRVYEGQFKVGKFHGHGRMEWHMPAGLMVYEGQYVNDLKDGRGRYVWPDRRVYDGEWKRGMREGKAVYTNAHGQSRTGIWKEDAIERWLDE
mmetsp:Transcript_75214/g.164091  ORF Transcript_75214/g.164091 Transcript_75214/m.164091 type:complete len:209 (+) Transcript_75214:86-712(+)